MSDDPRDLFHPDAPGIEAGMHRLVTAMLEPGRPGAAAAPLDLPEDLPGQGADPRAVLDALGAVLDASPRFVHPGFLGHMDPPTPWPTWVTAAWAAALNQNLLHPETSPQVRQVEERVVGWLTRPMGMAAGHLVPGSTHANLTALWAAREVTGARRVVASEAAHLSVPKAAAILVMEYVPVPAPRERLDPARLPDDLSDAVLVLTAGTTITGAVDPLDAGAGAAWRHVDAAWSGPLVYCPARRGVLAGIEGADSVAMSCHKWLFQPKESALVAFREAAGQDAITFTGPYLSAPNVGLAGSHGAAAALGLAATLGSLGASGVAELVDRCATAAERVAHLVDAAPELELWGPASSGIAVWRPRGVDLAALRDGLAGVFVSLPLLEGERWFRSVAANPWADPGLVVGAVLDSLGDSGIG